MIERYSLTKMANLWSENEKYKTWAKVERAHLEVLVNDNICDKKILNIFDETFNNKKAEDYLKREEETSHDLAAFIAEIGDSMGHYSAFLHRGLTSSDIIDTSLVLRIRESITIIIKSLELVRIALCERAMEHANTICIGRTHGVHAEPISFGVMLSGHFAEFQRHHKELIYALNNFNYGKLSGATGQYSQHSPLFEKKVLKLLDLIPETLATQVIPRDRILKIGQNLVNIALAIERLAINIRHLARTEIGEIVEPFGVKQKGSSAMPHKKNPILAENLSGLARTIVGYNSMLEKNVSLWHERDISHSSVERIAIADMFMVTDFMLVRLANLIKHMLIRPDVMNYNLAKTGGLWASQSVLTKLVDEGLNRSEAYEIVQNLSLPISMKVSTGVIDNALKEACLNNDIIKNILTTSQIEEIFSTTRFLTYVPNIYDRVFGINVEAFNNLTNSSITAKVPALQTIIKIIIELKSSSSHQQNNNILFNTLKLNISALEFKQHRSFIIKLENDNLLNNIKECVKNIVPNEEIETYKIEVIQ